MRMPAIAIALAICIAPTLAFPADIHISASRTEAPAPVPGYLDSSRELVLYALGLIGVRYKFGGNSPELGFDCSGLVRYVYLQTIGLALPHNAREISRAGETVPQSDLQPGDLVFYNTLRQPFSHVGIYLGDQRFVHAPSRGGGVEIVDMRESYWTKRYDGSRRVTF